MNPFVIGITGGMGSGKSYVAGLLHTLYNIPVYDCDREARRIMVENDHVRQQLCELIGADAYTANGQLNKPVIAAYLFGSQAHAASVNAIVHPAVKADFRLWTAAQTAQTGVWLVAVESAILIEAGFTDTVDCVVAIEAPEELRIQRAIQRDGTTALQARQRLAHQLTDSERRPHACCVVTNDGRPLLPQLQPLVQQLLVKTHKSGFD